MQLICNGNTLCHTNFQIDCDVKTVDMQTPFLGWLSYGCAVAALKIHWALEYNQSEVRLAIESVL